MADKSTPPPVAAKPASTLNAQELELGAGALALIALGAGAFALARRRRRRRDEEELWAEKSYAAEPAAPAAEPAPRHDPIFDEHQPPVVAPAASAFAWGNQRTSENAGDDGSDRRPGETWVERAYRGPSPANPSVSLRARLKRAAFFDKRERDVAAGTAAPVDADAGLPEAVVEEQEAARELA
jgi:hypothetical protein